jgi:hypothetical protein
LSRVIILYSKSDVLYIVAFGPQIIQVAICLTWYQSPGLGFRMFATSVLQFIGTFFSQSSSLPATNPMRHGWAALSAVGPRLYVR